MKLVQVAEQNKRYYTKEFIHGFNVGAKTQYEADKKDAERRGRWTTERTMEHDGEWYCSVCGYEPIVYEATNYCPNCGARMEARESDE